jgi:hypothetical protein
MGEMVDNALACTQSGRISASIPAGPLMDMLEVIDSGPVELLNRDRLAELAAGELPKQRRVNVECLAVLEARGRIWSVLIYPRCACIWGKLYEEYNRRA